MNGHIFSQCIPFAILFSAAFSAPAKDLDAALEAEKKKVRFRVYSERAILDDTKWVMPKMQSKEEKALDRELEKLENRLNNQFTPSGMAPARRVPSPARVKKENWLTPDLLNAETGKESDFKEENSGWMAQELDRQKSIQAHKKSLAEEEALVNKMLREDSRKNAATQSGSRKTYDPFLWNTMVPKSTPAASERSPFNLPETFHAQEKRSLSGKGGLFSPSVRSDSGIIKRSFQSPSSSASSKKPDWRTQLKSSTPTTTSKFKLDWNTKKSKPLPPLKRVRRSLPIHREDPFSDEFIPDTKTSIWD